MSDVIEQEVETQVETKVEAPATPKWKMARPGTKREEAAVVMRNNEGRPADEVIALIAGTPYDWKKGEPRAFYNWCAENGYGPGQVTARAKSVSVAGGEKTTKYRPATKDVTLAQIAVRTPEEIRSSMEILSAKLKKMNEQESEVEEDKTETVAEVETESEHTETEVEQTETEIEHTESEVDETE